MYRKIYSHANSIRVMMMMMMMITVSIERLIGPIGKTTKEISTVVQYVMNR